MGVHVPRNTIVQGNALHVLKSLPDQCVHTVVTSPPYWGLRAYGTEPQIWPDGWRGELGLEPSPELYVQHLVDIFGQVRRVLRSDGTLWLNLGDSYWGGKGRSGSGDPEDQAARRLARRSLNGPEHHIAGDGKIRPSDGRHRILKPKDLVGIPWRVAFALQQDGWYLRSDILWAKPNPLPESVTDRPTRSHEYVFLLSKSPRYFYDAEAIKEPCESGPSDVRKMLQARPRIGGKHKLLDDLHSKANCHTNVGRNRAVGHPWGRNRRNVWSVATRAYSGAHFAVYPEKLVEPCILAGTSAKGVCPKCGAPWHRVTKKGRRVETGGTRTKDTPGIGAKDINTGYRPTFTCGWRSSCLCGIRHTVPALVLDPFLGSGTTALVARRLGRDFLGIELKPEYAEMARKRTGFQAMKGLN